MISKLGECGPEIESTQGLVEGEGTKAERACKTEISRKKTGNG